MTTPEPISDMALTRQTLGAASVLMPDVEVRHSSVGDHAAVGAIATGPDLFAVRLDVVPFDELDGDVERIFNFVISEDASDPTFEALGRDVYDGPDGQESVVLSYVIERQGRLQVAVLARLGDRAAAAVQVMFPRHAAERYEPVAVEIFKSLELGAPSG